PEVVMNSSESTRIWKASSSRVRCSSSVRCLRCIVKKVYSGQQRIIRADVARKNDVMDTGPGAVIAGLPERDARQQSAENMSTLEPQGLLRHAVRGDAAFGNKVCGPYLQCFHNL